MVALHLQDSLYRCIQNLPNHGSLNNRLPEDEPSVSKHVEDIKKLKISSWYRDSLRAGRSGDRIPVQARFSAPVQTGRGAHPPSYTMGTRSLTPGVKQSLHGVHHPPDLTPRLKKEYSYTSTPPSGSSWPVIGRPLRLHFIKI